MEGASCREMSLSIFFWIQDQDEPVEVNFNTAIGAEFKLVYSPSANSQEFMLFFDKNEILERWNKAAIGKWVKEEKKVKISLFTYPEKIELSPTNWRNSMVTWQLNTPIDQNKC